MRKEKKLANLTALILAMELIVGFKQASASPEPIGFCKYLSIAETSV